MSSWLSDRIPLRSEIVKEYKARGGLIAGILPIHYPRALFRAFDILPVEIWGPPKIDPTFGAAHLQPYVCSIVRNALSFIQTSTFGVVDLLLVPHACDSLQGLGSILLDFVRPDQPVVPLYLPRADRTVATGFLAQEFHALYRRLEEFSGRSPSDEDLMEAVLREEDADALLAELHGRHPESSLSDEEHYRVLRAREFLPAESFSVLARKMLALIGSDTRRGIPLFLSGILPEPMDLLPAISQLGGRVVADDLACCGRRLYPAGRSEDPIQRMAESLLGAPPDWSRGSPIQDRLQHLLYRIYKSGAKGVVFYNIKFCEPELFDLPGLRVGLQAEGIASVMVEVDINDPLSNQTLTRIEAFLEMIA
jgi:benzoyl-CoA reductase/2-hydroxyglutaryl-CoA dehydratase subunit BcrC/BadD/HgdB